MPEVENWWRLRFGGNWLGVCVVADVGLVKGCERWMFAFESDGICEGGRAKVSKRIVSCLRPNCLFLFFLVRDFKLAIQIRGRAAPKYISASQCCPMM